MQQKTFQEFRAEVSNRNGAPGKIRNCYGTYDIYKYIRKNHWKRIGQFVSEHDFYTIIRGINTMVADEIANGQPVKFPHGMGHLELRKSHRGVSIVNNKLHNTYPIDWMNTLYLWWQDEEAHKQKTLVRHDNEWVYTTKYLREKANYTNRGFYQFRLNKEVRQALSRNIRDGKVDTIWVIRSYKDIVNN